MKELKARDRFIESLKTLVDGRRDLVRRLRDLGEGALNMIYPEKCLLCRHLPCQRDEAFQRLGLCDQCRREIYRISLDLEKTDSEPPSVQGETETRCFRWVHVSYRYEDRLRDAVERMKYDGKKSYGACFGRWMYDEGKENPVLGEFLKNCDVIVPVPLARNRLKERGYNQSELMAKALSEACGGCVENLLVRIRETRPQKDLGEWMREKNVQGAFEIAPSLMPDRKPPERIILVDDIYTTGATLAECAAVLKRKWPNSEIIGWVFCTERD